MAGLYNLRDRQPYGFTISGEIHALAVGIVSDYKEGYAHEDWVLLSDYGRANSADLGDWATFSISAARSHDSVQWIKDSTPDPTLHVIWSLTSGPTIIASGEFDITLPTTTVNHPGWPDNPNVTVDPYGITIPFSVHVEMDFEAYLLVRDIPPSAHQICQCWEPDGDGGFVPIPCPPYLWCDWSLDNTADWLPPQEGLVYLESDEDPVMTYSYTIGGQTSNGTTQLTGTYYNPGPMSASLSGGGDIPNEPPDPNEHNLSGYQSVGGVIAQVAFERTGGFLATPLWPLEEYAVGSREGELRWSIGGINEGSNIFTLYTMPANIPDGNHHIIPLLGPGELTDYCGSFTHRYSNSLPKYVDGPVMDGGAVLAVDEAEPQWHDPQGNEYVGHWACVPCRTEWNGETRDIEYGHGWWEIFEGTEGAFVPMGDPYSREWGTYLMGDWYIGVRQVNMFNLPDGYEHLGYVRQIGPVTLTNPADLGLPDHPATAMSPCNAMSYQDSRMPAAMVSDVAWHALRYSIPEGATKKSLEEGGSIWIEILPQASWHDRQPEGPGQDYLSTINMGTIDGAPAWGQVIGHIFVDGVHVSSIIQTIFRHVPNMRCDPVTIGDRWITSFVACTDEEYRCYPGSPQIACTLLDTPQGDNWIAYLDPGLHGGPMGAEGVVDIWATLRLDRLIVPLAYGDVDLPLEKFGNGMIAVNTGVGVKTLHITQNGVEYDLTTDPLGFAITSSAWPTARSETRSLRRTLANPGGSNWPVTVQYATAEETAEAEVNIQNRMLTLLTMTPTPTELWPRYCETDGLPIVNTDDSPALECCA